MTLDKYVLLWFRVTCIARIEKGPTRRTHTHTHAAAVAVNIVCVLISPIDTDIYAFGCGIPIAAFRGKIWSTYQHTKICTHLYLSFLANWIFLYWNAAAAGGGECKNESQIPKLDAIPKEKQNVPKLHFCRSWWCMPDYSVDACVRKWRALFLCCNTFSCRQHRKFIKEKAGGDGSQHAIFEDINLHACTYSHTFHACRLNCWRSTNGSKSGRVKHGIQITHWKINFRVNGSNVHTKIVSERRWKMMTMIVETTINQQIIYYKYRVSSLIFTPFLFLSTSLENW